MPSTILSDNGVTSGTSGIKTTGSNDGTLALQTTTAGGAATTALSISTAQVVTLTNALAVTSGGTGVTTSTGTGAVVLGTSPTITTPVISSLSSASATALTLQSAGTTAVTIDTSQNVGVQITPVTTSLGPSIQLGNQMTLTSFNGNSCYFDNNIYYNGSFKYTGNGYGASLRFTDANFVFSNAPNNSSGAGASATLTERMRIDSSGNVGIGTSSPSQKLQVLAVNSTGFAGAAVQNQNTNVGIAGVQFSSDTTYFKSAIGQVRSDSNGVGSLVFYNASSTGAANWSTSDERMRITSGGDVLVGNTSIPDSPKFGSQSSGANPAIIAYATSGSFIGQVFQVRASRNTTTSTFKAINYYNEGAGADKFTVQDSGNCQNTNNSYGAFSDVKLKDNIVDATPKLADLMQVKVRNYNLKSDPTHKQIGVIAQELEQVFPAMVEESTDRDVDGNDLGTTTKAVKYSVFVPMLIKAIQELKAINDTQAETITALTARIVAIESKA